MGEDGPFERSTPMASLSPHATFWGSRGNYFSPDSLVSVLLVESQFVWFPSCEVSALLGLEVVSAEMEHLSLEF